MRIIVATYLFALDVAWWRSALRVCPRCPMISTPSSPSESVLNFLVRLLGRSLFSNMLSLFPGLAADSTLRCRSGARCLQIDDRQLILSIHDDDVQLGFVDAMYSELCKIWAKEIDGSDGEFADTCDLQNVCLELPLSVNRIPLGIAYVSFRASSRGTWRDRRTTTNAPELLFSTNTSSR